MKLSRQKMKIEIFCAFSQGGEKETPGRSLRVKEGRTSMTLFFSMIKYTYLICLKNFLKNIILFLTKIIIFEQKIGEIDISYTININFYIDI